MLKEPVTDPGRSAKPDADAALMRCAHVVLKEFGRLLNKLRCPGLSVTTHPQ